MCAAEAHGAGDLRRIEPLLDQLLPQLSLRREAQSEDTTAYDRYSVGVHHIAFEAWSREMVDERAEWLAERGAEIESGPEEYGYMPGYYAVFFYDPDGIKLEIVHIPGQAA